MCSEKEKGKKWLTAADLCSWGIPGSKISPSSINAATIGRGYITKGKGAFGAFERRSDPGERKGRKRTKRDRFVPPWRRR
jgi:hypothetical protein